MVKHRLTGMFFAALSYVSRPHKLIFKLLMDEEMNLLVVKISLQIKFSFWSYNDRLADGGFKTFHRKSISTTPMLLVLFVLF